MSEEKESPLDRTERLLGHEAVEKLHSARVAVFGLGGVGGYVAEALARSGVGELDLVDGDEVSVSNLNRQIFATTETVGQRKVFAARARLASVAPSCRLHLYDTFVLPENIGDFPFDSYDYVVDAVDTVAAKVAVVRAAKLAGVPVVSAMGAGNKVDAARLRLADISETSVCPLARAVRRALRKFGIERLTVVYSDEPPLCGEGAHTPASIAYVPAVAGMLLAQAVIQGLTGARR